MRPLEIVIPIFLAIYLLWPLFGRRPPAVGILPAFTMVVVASHSNIEGMRWQMYPLYAFAAVTFILSLPEFLRARRAEADSAPKSVNRAALILPLILLAISTALPALLPVPSLPRPSGPYIVGTASYTLTDPGRKEQYSGKDEPRKFMIQVWYPAEPPALNAKTARWMDNGAPVARAIAKYLKLPFFFLDHIVLAYSNSYPEAEPNKKGGPYPVIIFSHGWNGFRGQSTFLMEELASHGYVVVATEHTYGSVLTVFPDGQLAYNNPAALPSGKPQDEYETAARKLVAQWTGDIGFTLDTLARWNQSDPRFGGFFDLDRVGLSGHSTGGGAAIQFCSMDSRCKALIPLDAFMRPVAIETLDGGLKQPAAFIFSELWPFERNTELFNRFYSHVDPSDRVLTILGADHYDFSDLPALSPLAAQMGLKGPIPADRLQKTVRAYVLAFFDWHLKGQPTPLFNGPSPEYPDVRFDR